MRIMHHIEALFRTLLLVPIRVYQRIISPFTPAVCKYYPSCSAYAVTAIEHHGPLKGLAFGVWRLLRCNPWSRGGYDPVPGTPNILKDEPVRRDEPVPQDQREATSAPDSTTHEG